MFVEQDNEIWEPLRWHTQAIAPKIKGSSERVHNGSISTCGIPFVYFDKVLHFITQKKG
jgi:hypothetical protein